MNQVLEFGKRYGKWIAAGVVAGVVAAAAVLTYRADSSDEEEYTIVDEDAEQTNE